MAAYCDVDICAKCIPCPVHSAKRFPNEIAKMKTVLVLTNVPAFIPVDLGILIIEYDGRLSDSMLGYECGSELYARIRREKYSGRFLLNDVRNFDSYEREMDKLITVLLYIFQVKFADIIAEYTGTRHYWSMQNFRRAHSIAFPSIHRNILSFHNDYDPTEMQQYMDDLAAWRHVLITWKLYFKGKYPGAKSFSTIVMRQIFDTIIMISLTDPSSSRKDMNQYDFLDFFYELTLLALPEEICDTPRNKMMCE
jgi:hypothetical protein